MDYPVVLDFADPFPPLHLFSLLFAHTAFLSMHDPTQRLTKATDIFTKRAAIAEVTTKISQEVGESLSKQQKEFFLCVCSSVLGELRSDLDGLNIDVNKCKRFNVNYPG